MDALIITLDGPAGSGKSTMARRLAGALGLEFLDTGAMYRGLTALCLERGLDPAAAPEAAAETARRCVMRFDWAADPPRFHIELDGVDRDLTDRLRDADVTVKVSDIAANGAVRTVMVESQRRIGREHPRLVTEGRDQGSVVFPEAPLKFYLDASPQVRAQRRALELRSAGKPADEAEILRGILRRDQRDANRPDGPLICPPDAVRIDTTRMTLDEVLDLLTRTSRQRLSGALGAITADAVGQGARPRTTGPSARGGDRGDRP